MSNSTKTKQLILEYIESNAAELLDEEELQEGINNFSAQIVAEKFNVSRNLASQYLNELVKEGVIEKTNSRPVFFYFRKMLEKKNERSDFRINKEDYEQSEQSNDVFENVIGHNGSLRNVIDQCKAATKYPPNGLPILLTGTSGAGKSYLANMIFNYAVEQKIIEEDKQFVIVNCSEFANNPELLTANLFGYKKGAFTGADSDNMGLIQAANGGVLFLDEVHSLNPSCQKKLFLFMDKGIYHLMGDNKNWKESSARLVFATTKDPEQALLRTLLRRIPVTINVPDLEERPIDEKEQLIFSFIQNEAKQIKKKIKLTQSYLQTLMSYRFRANVGELKSAIKRSCANAFLYHEEEGECLILKMFHLPENIIAYASFFITINEDEGDKLLFDPSKTKVEDGVEKILLLFDSLLKENDLYMEHKSDNKAFMEHAQKIITKYYDYLMFDKKNKNLRLEAYETAMEKVTEEICSRYKIQFQNNGLIPLIRYLVERGSYKSQIFEWERNEKERIDELYNMLKNKYEYEFSITEDFSEKVETIFDIRVSKMNRIILLLNIKFFNPEIKVQQIMGVVLSHGYSTASSIADAVNKLLDDYVFEAIDMPLDVTASEIGERLQSLVRRRHLSQDIILLVDMGSLEEIYKEISIIPNLNIGIINNITTKMALDVGLKIQNNDPMVQILESASKNTICSYKIIENRVREKAIIFVSETGIETARNMSELFLESLPRTINVKIIPYDYYMLMRNGINDEVFSENEVIFIAGTLNPNIKEIPYIAVEDIIGGNQLEVLHEAFSTIFSVEEMQALQNSMLMNFSLQNVVGYLTILNADKVLELVNNALNILQERLQIQLKYKSIISLNVHLSCLVERLVKKIPIETYFELDVVEREQARFIDACKDSFVKIERHYGVILPISEIAYIYDYFKAYM
ncbi:sigma-54 dependent transcriptional regulator of gfr operon [Clostridium beijerinckii]|uniref:sigma 54-interacting transcriptional regulator n=1 Tax=Clostridium beijerinckii TaxID=1520 RepID=UPI001570E67C|nr:sigma 54-interacting transcriptional regulator [Clostridium beijerinckii]NRT36208.1 sigma-54 dependent transcriptional regulator of gfr operon [Clostridium beijerinckii]NRT44365.1 sigma-54 dependent transcriptional regulator of gfr operon [Clostridium beijerinckii]NRZ21643.1 sigma-54 dependent transcriptional regulator of gfr operon [Clostridium beijerinckii]